LRVWIIKQLQLLTLYIFVIQKINLQIFRFLLGF